MAGKFVPVHPETLRWAREDVGLTLDQAAERGRFSIDRLRRWERGAEQVGLSQAKKLANLYKVAVPVLYLKKVPEEWAVQKPEDFRRPDSKAPYSYQLCLAIREARERQQWLREYAQAEGRSPLEWLSCHRGSEDAASIAGWVVEWLDADRTAIEGLDDAKEALAYWVEKIEAKHVAVLTNNTHATRKIEHAEYSGLVLHDEYAPLILLNPADAPARRIFTLIHELGHLLLDDGNGVSKIDFRTESGTDAPLEALCNRIASDVLIENRILRTGWSKDADALKHIAALSRQLKVSHSAIAVKMGRQGMIAQEVLDDLLEYYRQQFQIAQQRRSGGRTVPDKQVLDRCGKLFVRSVLGAYEQGSINAPEIYDLLGMKLKHLSNLSDRLQFPLHRWIA